jgi:hypothetical protein
MDLLRSIVSVASIRAPQHASTVAMSLGDAVCASSEQPIFR